MLELLAQFNFRQVLVTWWAALTDPWQFLSPSYNPNPEQIAAGFEFYVGVFLITMAVLLMTVLACGRGSTGIRAKMLGYGLLGLAMFVVVAIVMHFAFSLLGGKASLAGTCLTYVYAAAPYQPLIAFASWVIASGMPAQLRPYILNPFTSSEAGARAAKHPETDMVTVGLGTLASVGLIIWTLILVFRALRYGHDLDYLWSLAAFAIGLIVVSVLNRVFMRMSGTLSDVPQEA